MCVQLCNGLAGTKEGEAFGLTTADQYRYLSKTACYTVKGVNDAAEYEQTKSSMAAVGMDRAEQQNCLAVAAAVLNLGNINFVEQMGKTVVDKPSDVYVEVCVFVLFFFCFFLCFVWVACIRTDMTRPDKTAQDSTRQDKTRHDKTRQ